MSEVVLIQLEKSVARIISKKLLVRLLVEILTKSLLKNF